MSSKTIDERLQILEDADILRNLNEYARSLDYDTEPSRFLDRFTEDGIWRSSVDVQFAGGKGVRIEGRAALERWFYEVERRVDPQRSGRRHEEMAAGTEPSHLETRV